MSNTKASEKPVVVFISNDRNFSAASPLREGWVRRQKMKQKFAPSSMGIKHTA